jgi:transposase
MLEVEDRFMIKDWQRRGISISEMARKSGFDRKTIRKVLAEPLVTDRQPRQVEPYKLGPYIEHLKKRMADGVYNASKLYTEIKEQGYPGGRTQVRAYVQAFRPVRPPAASVRYETAPGEQAQADWAHFGMIDHRGHARRLYAFLMTLGWSRTLYVEFTVSADAGWWLRCHTHAFRYFGGAPRVVLHDNLKTAVLSRDADGTIHWNPRYLDFAGYYGFSPKACQPYRAQTKGKVESGVRYLRQNFWPGLQFTDLVDLNQQALLWLDRVANVRRHGTTGVAPFERLPQEGLQPLLGKPDYDTSVISYRQSSADCLISYDGNYYSVPAGYHKQQLLVKETERGALLILSPQGVEIARHRLAAGYRQQVVDPAHYQGVRPSAAERQPVVARQAPPAAPAQQVAAPAVETRSLDIYQALAEAVAG